jgi:uncharacterized membrane protein YgdD (TMEM256/DUF423 family)
MTTLRLRIWLGVAGLSGAMAVAADAYARHGLDLQTGAYTIDLIRTASRYQGFHALALVVFALIAEHAGTGWARRALAVGGWALVAGLLLFCCGLYARAAGLPPALAVVIPVGGMAFITGWLALALAGAVWRR